MSDLWPDEPDEETPEDRWGDPERDLPRAPEAPTVPDPSGNDVPPDVAAAFWGAVVLVNVGLFAVALGPMLIFFRGQWEWGGGLFTVGALALAHAYQRYRRFRTERDADGDGSRGGDGDGNEGESRTGNEPRSDSGKPGAESDADSSADPDTGTAAGPEADDETADDEPPGDGGRRDRRERNR